MADPDFIRRDAIARTVAGRLHACSLDELRVLDQVLVGLERGRNTYGPLDLAKDARDWGAEAQAELRDFVFYEACRQIAARDRKLDQIDLEAARLAEEPRPTPPFATWERITQQVAARQPPREVRDYVRGMADPARPTLEIVAAAAPDCGCALTTHDGCPHKETIP